LARLRGTIDDEEIIMSIVIDAIWEKGVLTPETRLDLPEKSRVRVIVEQSSSTNLKGWAAIDRLIGLANDTGAPMKDVSENHDEYLYGEHRS
jgi:predicted DNA-binding antitoxin AbrB/MazE fold protein